MRRCLFLLIICCGIVPLLLHLLDYQVAYKLEREVIEELQEKHKLEIRECKEHSASLYHQLHNISLLPPNGLDFPSIPKVTTMPPPMAL